ncbi:MAG TPA: SDR family NAD(P)-dependent oxidoreductase [Acidimicrobiales bacterium]|nr:SDR family NAD(P)-dependent oxidoreductase [Acidimicrobiales bacterium]
MGALEGAVAVVAGASRGIGKGIALELGAAGAHVVVSGRTLEGRPGAKPGSLEETAAEIVGAGGSAMPVRCDFTDDADVAALFTAVNDEHGSLDILVNSVFNALEFSGSIGRRFWELPVDTWREVVDVGTRSAYVAAVHAAPMLLGSERGLIVNVSGRAAERYLYNVPYGVGKAALDKMTRDMAEELRDDAVAVVSIWPNVTRTENVDASSASGSSLSDTFGDLDLLETPRYSGRAVVALAADDGVMDRTGGRFWVAELGLDYGLTDENGRSHPIPS